jgi:hypothetical protein
VLLATLAKTQGRLDVATRGVVTSRSTVLATRLSTRRVLFAFPKVDGVRVV